MLVIIVPSAAESGVIMPFMIFSGWLDAQICCFSDFWQLGVTENNNCL